VSIRVLTADDHPVVRTGIRAMIGNEPDMCVVAEAADGEAAVALTPVFYTYLDEFQGWMARARRPRLRMTRVAAETE